MENERRRRGVRTNKGQRGQILTASAAHRISRGSRIRYRTGEEIHQESDG